MPGGGRACRAALLGVWGALACSEPPPPNLLLISIDTLRADHVGSYGYERDTTPHLDALAERSLRYAEARAPTPWTLPSHAALLTGRHPWPMGVVETRSTIPEEVTLVTGRLAEAGYTTAAFVDSAPGAFLGARRGFDRGFERYEHAPHPGEGPYRYDVEKTVDRALRWLDARAGGRGGAEESEGNARRKPFFLFLHTKTVHATSMRTTRETGRDVPYDTPDPYRERFLEGDAPRFAWREEEGVRGVNYLQLWNEALARGAAEPAEFGAGRRAELVALYDAGIAYVDRHLGRLLDALRARGLRDSTVVVVVSDHGESFLGHRLLLHKELYEPLLRVPLLLHDPREGWSGVVERPVALRDVAPTLLELAGLPPLSGASGRVLPPRRAPPERPRGFFAFYRSGSQGLYEGFALRRGTRKVLHHRFADGERHTAVYDLARDRAEQRPLDASAPRARALRKGLAERVAEDAERAPRLELDGDTREGLRALGYVD